MIDSDGPLPLCSNLAIGARKPRNGFGGMNRRGHWRDTTDEGRIEKRDGQTAFRFATLATKLNLSASYFHLPAVRRILPKSHSPIPCFIGEIFT
jgi:hypothetical protein